jgi:hypothetical protein
LKYLYSVETVRSIAHSIICKRLFRGKMHSDWLIGLEIIQGRWQHGEKVGYCYPGGLEKTLCKWDIYVLLVTKGLNKLYKMTVKYLNSRMVHQRIYKSLRLAPESSSSRPQFHIKFP